MNAPKYTPININRSRLIDRFLRYVAIDTTADPNSSSYPSSPNQRQLAEVVAKDLRAAGVADVDVDQHSLVWANLPANREELIDAPPLMFNSHLDTSPDSPGANVRARVVENYAGGAIQLREGIEIDAVNTPELPNYVGKTLIVTDGTTLLGGDDKAGVAVLVELAATLIEQNLPHGPIQILFTCDEEIGQGTKCVDLARCHAKYGYTLDGSNEAIVESENFSADCAKVTFRGVSIHPAIAKNRMVNAVRAAADFVSRLPMKELSPESTEDRQGFLHPYGIDGQAGLATVRILLRDFETAKLLEYRKLLEETAAATKLSFPGLEIELDIVEQYRNMADGIRQKPEIVSLALGAYSAIGLEPKEELIRGGTDGAMFTAKGILMPNLAVGQHNIHSVREFVCVDEMETALAHLTTLCPLAKQLA